MSAIFGPNVQIERRGPGRPRSIPPELFETILQLYKGGLGYRSIANHLRGLGINATFNSVRRLVKGQGAYAKLLVRADGFNHGSELGAALGGRKPQA